MCGSRLAGRFVDRVAQYMEADHHELSLTHTTDYQGRDGLTSSMSVCPVNAMNEVRTG